MKATIARSLAVAALATLALQSAHAQTAPDRARVLRAAADALGMVRWSDIGTNTTRLPGIDIVNTQELQASGTIDNAGQAVTGQYHVTLGYNPAAMRVTITPAGAGARRAIHTVRETWAWDESEIGAGLVPGKGTATPAAAATRERLLQLWTLPFGVVKAALAAGDKTTVATEGGATVVTFPLSGPLAGVTVKATLDASSLVTKVETQAATPALVTQAEYSNYADRAEVLTDIKTPGRIVRKQGGRTLLDIEVKTWETNNPYLVFPVPPSVKAAAATSSR
ncbi:MAG: hypothetical protein HY824_15130 [Acidobacteria bacterium]|nr:hypothetical protein [Acidobacteriota bacterium]